MLELAIAVIAILSASALFSCVEAAFFSLPLTKARQMAEKSHLGALVCKIRENPARPISTIVILNNLANIAGTYFIADLASSRLDPTIQTWFPFVLTTAIIVLSEILPKTIGQRFCVPISLLSVRPLLTISLLLSPIVWVIEKLTKLFVKHDPDHMAVSEHEIMAMARIGEKEGAIGEGERMMIVKIFEFDDVRADQIMTPRTAVTWIRGIEPLRIAAEKIGNGQHSRVLVVGESIDDVKGIVHKNIVLRALINGHDQDALVEDLCEPVKLIPPQTPADELLEFFKTSRVHLAVIVDEYGGVSGIVTLEDVLEVLTGEIVDETDLSVDMREVAKKNGISIIQNQVTQDSHRILVGHKKHEKTRKQPQLEFAKNNCGKDL
jgi:CBS domain containing-hemolysin-like protein